MNVAGYEGTIDIIKAYRSGNSSAREAAISANLPLVGFIAAKFTGRGHDYEDLYQYGCIGLIKAVDRFDPNYDVAFSTYAVPLISGEIRRFLRSDGSIHISRTIKENALKISRSLSDGQSRTVDEVSDMTGLSHNDVVIAMSAISPVKSFDEPIGTDGGLTLGEMLGSDTSEYINDRIALSQAFATLTEEEKELLFRRYYKRHTQTMIAAEKGLSQVQVSRAESKVLKKLREMLSENTDVGLK